MGRQNLRNACHPERGAPRSESKIIMIASVWIAAKLQCALWDDVDIVPYGFYCNESVPYGIERAWIDAAGETPLAIMS